MAGGSHADIRPIWRKAPVDVILQPFHRFARFEAAGGVLLLLATIAALWWANSPYAESYLGLWQETKFTIGFNGAVLSKPLVLWINDLLMAVFFLLVGLEIKREMIVGELASPRRAAVPILAAVGGMAVPGMIYGAFNAGLPSSSGWGVPMATDIAFALGILALLGPRVPLSLRVFLASLAIIDDLGALLVIAIFYTENISMGYLGGAGVCLAVLIALNLAGVRHPFVYALIGLFLWFAMFKSGVHATIAGVVLAMTIPARTRVNADLYVAEARAAIDEFERAGSSGESIITNSGQQNAVKAVEIYSKQVETPLQRLEHRLLPWVSFLIVPVFALANAGVGFAQGATPEGWSISRAQWGIAAGLILGKPIGIMLFSWMAVKLRIGSLPGDVSWRHVFGASCMAGIGFTMALFIAGLAFKDSSQMLAEAKVAVLGASLVAGILGFAILWTTPPVANGNGNGGGNGAGH